MMEANKTHHGLAVLLCLIVMFFQFSLVSSTTDGSAATESTTTRLTTDPSTMTTTTTTMTTTTTIPPPETNAPTTGSEPTPTSTLDGISTAAGPSTTPDTTTSDPATTGQTVSVDPISSTITSTPTTPPTTMSSSSGSTTPPAFSGVTSLPSSSGAEPDSTTKPAGSETIAVSSTTVSTESTASPEGPGSATSTPESSVSVLTSTPPSPTVTSTANVTVSTATTPAAATTTAKHAYPTKKPEKPFRLDFEVGDSNASTVYCTDNCTFDSIVGAVQTAFSSVPGYLYVESGGGAANRRRRDTRFSVALLFNQGVMVSLTAEDRTAAVYMGFQNLDRSSLVQVQIDQVNETIVDGFVARTADMCKVPNTCPLGYRCGQGVCYHLCENHDCSSNGVCQAVVDTDGSSRATCVCNSGYEHTYSGAHCENEETSGAKKAAIVGGVLGTFCAIFLILILFLYCRLRESDGGSKRNYQLGGYSNNGYADQEFAMRNPASDDP